MNRHRDIPVRIVPLRSSEASDSFVEGTIDERLALVSLLSRRAWELTGRPHPTYARNAVPVVVRRLADR